MSTFEKTTIVLSLLAFMLSITAFIISLVKSANERKAFKKQFIVDNLINLRANLNKELTSLEQLDPEISVVKLFNRIELNEQFDYYDEILKLYNSTTILVSNSMILLSSYINTQNKQNLMKALKDISADVGYCFQIIINHREDREQIIKKFVEYKTISDIKYYTGNKIDLLIELSNTINHFMKDKISKDEINSYFVVVNLQNDK